MCSCTSVARQYSSNDTLPKRKPGPRFGARFLLSSFDIPLVGAFDALVDRKASIGLAQSSGSPGSFTAPLSGALMARFSALPTSITLS